MFWYFLQSREASKNVLKVPQRCWVSVGWQWRCRANRNELFPTFSSQQDSPLSPSPFYAWVKPAFYVTIINSLNVEVHKCACAPNDPKSTEQVNLKTHPLPPSGMTTGRNYSPCSDAVTYLVKSHQTSLISPGKCERSHSVWF